MPNVLRKVALAAFALLLASVQPVLADQLGDLKAEGIVGERIDGYVGFVSSRVTRDVRAYIDDLNAKRRQSYAGIAQKRGVPVDAVAQIAGQKLIDKAPRGQYVMGADGRWRQK
jgi:uncharacterized protein